MAGVACILSKYLRKVNFQSSVVSKTTKEHDPFNFLSFYKEHGVPSNSDGDFLPIMNALAKKARIIHVHGIPSLISRFKSMGKRTILHCHGSELVMNQQAVAKSGANAIIVSTPNLLEYDLTKTAIHIPNPIDTDLFYDTGQSGVKWLMFKIRYLDMEWIENYLGASHMYREIYDREAHPISYADMPTFLKNYCGYIDIKYDKNYGHLVKVFSKSALEALACGLPVVNWNKEIVRGLPEEHKPENVVKKLIEVYQSIV